MTGIDPFRGMLERARSRLPTSTFIQGIAEALPVQSASFELVTAAGSLNYTDTHAALAETSRVLAPDGYLAAYDFCTGRVLSTESREASCFQSFERTFPWPPEYPLDLEALPYREHGLTLVLLEHFLVELQMTANGYIRYIMSETNVEAAISNGTSEAAARDECWRTFGPLFARGPRTVGFRAVLALARKEAGAIDCDA